MSGFQPIKPVIQPLPKIDNSHVSDHFRKGQFEYPITQKIRLGRESIKINTEVDNFGNVGQSFFDD